MNNAFQVYTFCTACAADFAFTEINLEEVNNASGAWERCSCCGYIFIKGERRWRTNTARIKILPAEFSKLLHLCRERRRQDTKGGETTVLDSSR